MTKQHSGQNAPNLDNKHFNTPVSGTQSLDHDPRFPVPAHLRRGEFSKLVDIQSVIKSASNDFLCTMAHSLSLPDKPEHYIADLWSMAIKHGLVSTTCGHESMLHPMRIRLSSEMTLRAIRRFRPTIFKISPMDLTTIVQTMSVDGHTIPSMSTVRALNELRTVIPEEEATINAIITRISEIDAIILQWHPDRTTAKLSDIPVPNVHSKEEDLPRLTLAQDIQHLILRVPASRITGSKTIAGAVHVLQEAALAVAPVIDLNTSDAAHDNSPST